MVEIIAIAVSSSTGLLWIAQAPTAQNASNLATAGAASSAFSGAQFFVALVSGILLTFAFQLLLTNLSVALGISYLGRSSHAEDHDQQESEGIGVTVRKIGFGMGAWTLVTVSAALFAACFLAVHLSLLSLPQLGAIVGLVIWAAYFSLLVWVSSTAVGSLIGSVVGTATSGFQALLGTATAAIGSRAAKKQVVSTAEAITAAVRNELGSGIDPANIRHSIEDYVQQIRLPGFDLSKIRRDFEDLLNDPEVEALAGDERLHHIDRQTFIDLISRRTDFTREEVDRLAGLLEGVWRQTLGQRRGRNQTAELMEYLRSTQPGQLRVEELNAKLDRLLAERNQTRTESAGKNAGLFQQTLQYGANTLIGLLTGRTDLSDIDLEKILTRLKTAPEKLTEQTGRLVGQLKGDRQSISEYSPIRTDVEDYLLNKYSWQMNRETIAREFREILYDQDADPSEVAQQLSSLSRSYFVELLRSRGVFTQAQVREIADQAEAIRLEVTAEAQAAKEREISLDLRQRVERYLTLTPKEQLNASKTLPAFKALLEDEAVDYETLSQRLAPYDREALRKILLQRQEIASESITPERIAPESITLEEIEAILPSLETARDRVLFESQSLDEQAKQQLIALQQQLEDYLRNTGKTELSPDGIKRDLKLMLSDPQSGLSALRYRTAQFDRDTLVKLLSQREDITESEANQILDQVESSWYTLLSSPQIIADAVTDKYAQTVTSLADYLRRTNLEELDPDGIQRDLTLLLDDPQEGTLAIRRRLSHIDRETLVRLLSQRQDLTEEQVNRSIDQVQNAIRRIIRSPRRLALRAQRQVMDFEASIEDYLRNTSKAELNPEGIKRDFNLLVQSPQQGWQSLSDRLSQFDRDTLVALLAQRQDITPEEANQIVAQVEAVRDQILDQMRQIQHRIQATIDRIFARIRDYLNSLNRPELNYEGVKQDIYTLFDDPQAGFEALRTRLSEFDRDTVVALLSSRRDISEADANRIIDQVESARNSVLQRAERVQQEAQRRLESVKIQAQRQVEETRKAAAIAAWWLFVTALTSAIAAAGAGAIAAT